MDYREIQVKQVSEQIENVQTKLAKLKMNLRQRMKDIKNDLYDEELPSRPRDETLLNIASPIEGVDRP